MLASRGSLLLFLAALGALLIGHAPAAAVVGLVLLYSAILFCGSVFIRLRFFIPSACHGPDGKKEVALTFDDGPSANQTPVVLDALRHAGAEAAFFCIGRNIPGNEALCRRLLEEGHLLGNHSFSHDNWFDLFGADRMTADLRAMGDAAEAATGRRPKLFRPPYGVTNPNLARAVRRENLVSIGWSVRSFDTASTDEKKLLRRLTRALRPGAIILLHDRCAITARILPELLQTIRAQGYAVTRLDKMLHLPPYA